MAVRLEPHSRALLCGDLQSGRVMEKLEMKYEGRPRQHVGKWGAFVDVVLCGILRLEYEDLSSSGER